MDDVAANLDAQVTTDGARGRVLGIGGSKNLTTSLDNVQTLPDHGDDRSRGHVLDKTREEGTGREVSIVLLQEILSRPDELEADELETLGLEPLDDLADKPALDAVGLDHDEGTLGDIAHGCGVVVQVVERTERCVHHESVGRKGACAAEVSGSSRASGIYRKEEEEVEGKNKRAL